MNRKELLVGSAFLVLGVALVVSSYALPAGMGRLPGPGFFPRVIGGVMTLLSLALLWRARRGEETVTPVPTDLRTVAGVVGLLLLYLLLWGTGLFPVRTAVFLLVLLRFLGQPWRSGLTVSLSLTVAIVLAFQIGLRVSLE
jgi:hypothetical protein